MTEIPKSFELYSQKCIGFLEEIALKCLWKMSMLTKVKISVFILHIGQQWLKKQCRPCSEQSDHPKIAFGWNLNHPKVFEKVRGNYEM